MEKTDVVLIAPADGEGIKESLERVEFPVSAWYPDCHSARPHLTVSAPPILVFAPPQAEAAAAAELATELYHLHESVTVWIPPTGEAEQKEPAAEYILHLPAPFSPVTLRLGLQAAARLQRVLRSSQENLRQREVQEELLLRRLAMEELVSSLSGRFLAIPLPQTTAEMQRSLQVLATYFACERGFLILCDADDGLPDQVLEWPEPATRERTEQWRSLLLAQRPRIQQTEDEVEVLTFRRPAEIPAAGLGFLFANLPFRAGIAAPLWRERSVMGVLGFGGSREKERWEEEEIKLMKLISELFTNVLLRRDAEEREKRRQQEMMQAEKMISLGTLVAGVAHEINNPNNAIMFNTPLLQEIFADLWPLAEKAAAGQADALVGGLPLAEVREAAADLFAGVMKSSERIKAIVSDLRNFARPDSQEMNQSVQLNEVVRNAVSLLGNMIAKSTRRFSVHYGEGLPPLTGNFQKLEQVVINLLQNACQALTDPIQAVSVATALDAADGCLLLTVCDEGGGIDPADIQYLTDPFFTRKRDQGGIGLGLSIVSRILKDHGAAMQVESEPGHGSLFRVVLPLPDQESRP